MKREEKKSTFTAIIDRVEKVESGDVAVLELEEGGHLDFPTALLPSSLHEGAYYRFEISENPEGEKKLRNDISDLQKRLLERTKKEGK